MEGNIRPGRFQSSVSPDFSLGGLRQGGPPDPTGAEVGPVSSRRYFRGGWLGRISTLLGSARSGKAMRSVMTRATSWA